MATETLTETRTPVDTSTSEFLAIVAAQSKPEYAPGRSGGRQASFDAVAAWNAVGMID